jgi:hypothetical protein
MAFKSIDRNDTVKVVVSNDPAVNKDGSDFEKYRDSFDESFLSFLDGEEPTRFILGTVSYLKFQAIKDKHISFDIAPDGSQNIKTNIFGMTAETLAYSLRGVENAPFNIKQANGKVTDDVMDKLGALDVVEELGNIALALNGFGGEDEKKS